MWGLHLYKMARTLRGTCGLLLSTAKGQLRNWLNKQQLHSSISNWLGFSLIIWGHICTSLDVTQREPLGLSLRYRDADLGPLHLFSPSALNVRVL